MGEATTLGTEKRKSYSGYIREKESESGAPLILHTMIMGMQIRKNERNINERINIL